MHYNTSISKKVVWWKSLTMIETAVMNALIAMADTSGSTNKFCSTDYICELSNMKRSSAKKGLKGLVDKGCFKTVKNYGIQHKTPTFELLTDADLKVLPNLEVSSDTHVITQKVATQPFNDTQKVIIDNTKVAADSLKVATEKQKVATRPQKVATQPSTDTNRYSQIDTDITDTNTSSKSRYIDDNLESINSTNPPQPANAVVVPDVIKETKPMNNMSSSNIETIPEDTRFQLKDAEKMESIIADNDTTLNPVYLVANFDTIPDIYRNCYFVGGPNDTLLYFRKPVGNIAIKWKNGTKSNYLVKGDN